VKPTIAVSIDTAAPSVANADEASRVLLWGEQLPSGIAPMSSVQPLNSQSDANTNYGKRSIVARLMRAALSQGAVGVKFFGVGVPAATAGTAGIAQIVTNIVDANGAIAANPISAGGATISLGGTEFASISWTTSDTLTTIGASLIAALNALEFAPFGTWSNATGVVTATANIKGAVIEDYPIRVTYAKAGTGVYFGPGSITLATNAGGSDGTVVLLSGATTIAVTITNGDTPTAAGDKVVAVIGGYSNAGVQSAANDAYPLTAGKNVAGAIPLYYQPGEDVRRPAAKVLTSTGMTVIFQGGTITDGDGLDDAGSISYSNVPGAGYPSLTTAVANVRQSGSFGKHVSPWLDATTDGAIFAAIVSDGDGGPTHQKGQTLTLGSAGTEAAAETFLGATSPAMTSTVDNAGMRGALLVFPDAACPAGELAARAAAGRASSAAFTNYDGFPLKGTADVPLLLPSQRAIAKYDDATQNNAIRAGVTPLGVVDGSLVVIFGRTTMATTAAELFDWSWIDQADNHRLDFRAQAKPTFAGAALISPGTPPASRLDVDPQAIEGFAKEMLRRWEKQGTYDGADALASLCKAQINPSQRSRADLVYPESPKVPLHTIGVVAQRSSPPSS
jgi:phage tail sheath gpL-like